MGTSNDRTVYQRKDGQWVNQLNSSDRPSSIHETWGEAKAVATRLIRRSGGGELVRKAVDGTVLSREVIVPTPKKPSGKKRSVGSNTDTT